MGNTISATLFKTVGNKEDLSSTNIKNENLSIIYPDFENVWMSGKSTTYQLFTLLHILEKRKKTDHNILPLNGFSTSIWYSKYG